MSLTTERAAMAKKYKNEEVIKRVRGSNSPLPSVMEKEGFKPRKGIVTDQDIKRLVAQNKAAKKKGQLRKALKGAVGGLAKGAKLASKKLLAMKDRAGKSSW